jgi:hypothetical protein
MKISLCIDIFAKSPMNIRSANYSSELTYNTLSMSLLTTKTDIHFIRQTYKKLKQIVKLVFKYVIFICLQISPSLFSKKKESITFFFQRLIKFSCSRRSPDCNEKSHVTRNYIKINRGDKNI